MLWPPLKRSEMPGDVRLCGGERRRADVLWGGCDPADGVHWTGLGTGETGRLVWYLPSQLRRGHWRPASSAESAEETVHRDRTAWWDYLEMKSLFCCPPNVFLTCITRLSSDGNICTAAAFYPLGPPNETKEQLCPWGKSLYPSCCFVGWHLPLWHVRNVC